MTNTRLLVLGILNEKPMHGYEIRKWLEERKAELWADVLPGSIYNALKSMSAEGLVKVDSTERTGNRLRAIYMITPKGEEELKQLLRSTWRELPASFPTGIYAALAFVDDLPRRDVLQAITEMTEKMDQALAR
jgi:DNA-binding PadR family transcriptional regulator